MTEPIAIVGIGCRFPGAEGMDAFWRILERGIDCVTEVPVERWNMDAFYDAPPAMAGKSYCRWGAFLRQGDAFDAEFFDISAHDAMHMDPQHGIVLETAWQALEVAGIVPRSLAGTRAGVFVGISNSDWDRMWSRDATRLDVAYVSGSSYSIAANRLSYFLNLQGPSVAVDTACSSSITAIHLACQSMHAGECELAFAGGVHLVLCADKLIAFSDGKSLARDGRCKPFDARADGSVWGEGCGMLVLKRLSAAMEAGDRIFGIVRGSAIGHYGMSNGMGAPSGPAQQSIISHAIESAALRPADLSYVEAHGSSTLFGDAIEAKALIATLSEERPADSRCTIGCVKGNLGHLEAAAGIAGVVKTLLALNHEHIPPTLHLRELSPHIPIAGTSCDIRSEGQPWLRGARPRCAGVSAFSFGGAGGHVVLEEAPDEEKPTGAPAECLRGSLPLTISARTGTALLRLAERYADYLSSLASTEDTGNAFAEVCLAAAVGRTHFLHRLALIAESPSEAAECLHAVMAAAGKERTSIARAPRRPPPLLFAFGVISGEVESLVATLCRDDPRFDRIRTEWLDRFSAAIAQADDLPALAHEQVAALALTVAFAFRLAEVGLKPRQALALDSIGLIAAGLAAGAFDEGTAVRLLPNVLASPANSCALAEAARPFVSPDQMRFPVLVCSAAGWGAVWQDRAVAIADLQKALTLVELGGAASFSQECPGVRSIRPFDADASLARAAAAAHLQGHAIDWAALFGGALARRRTLPLYPFERRRHYPVLDPNSAGFAPLVARRQEGQVEVTLEPEYEDV